MPKHYAIKCTNCAAPLDILGGGRVNTVTCSYCHSVLDMNAHYKVLAKFNDAKRPEAPFEIGMRGNIKGLEWQIIGWIHYKTGGFPSEEWDEFFLYSPTHGYAWLVYEKNKLFFSKRVRDFDILSWQERKAKTIFYHKGHYLQKEASYLTYVDYVEGELNWIAKFGDQFTTWDYEGVGFKTLNIEKTADEIEVYHTERLDKADVYRAFELTEDTQKITTIKEDNNLENSIVVQKADNNYVLKFLFISLLLVIVYSYFSSHKITSLACTKGGNTKHFTINSNAFLTQFNIITPNGLKKSSFSIYQGEKKIFEITPNTIQVYYTKKYYLYRWSETALLTHIYLQLDKGSYTLHFNYPSSQNATITINENVIRIIYIVILCLLIAVILYVRTKDSVLWKYALLLSMPFLLSWGYRTFGAMFLWTVGIILFLTLFTYYREKNGMTYYYTTNNDDDWDDDD